MSPGADSASVRRGNIRYFPVVPGCMEFAEHLRRGLLDEKPQVVAVELPVTLETAFQRAVDRLPELSVIIYEEDKKKDRAVYLPIEVSDPFVEALRTAREIGAQTTFLDPDIAVRPHVAEIYPDPYAVARLGPARYIDSYRGCRRTQVGDWAVHAQGLASKLQAIDPDASAWVVVSLNLLDPLLEAMEQSQVQPLRKVRRRGVQVLNLHPECLSEVLTDFPFLQAVYESRRNGEAPPPPPDPTTRQVRGFSVIGGPRENPSLAAIRRGARNPLERQRLHFQLFAEAERQYERNTGERITHWQRRLWSRYSRNLALIQQQLVGGLFDLTAAARSVVDDNFAWEMWEMGGSYPQQKIKTDLATVKVSGDQLWLNTRRIHIRRRLPRKKMRRRPIGLKGRKKERFPGEWQMHWKGSSICSYPPEDLMIENYGLFLKKKGKGILSEEHSHSEPFTTSLLDGIDLRETMRNWHEKKIYVRSLQRVSGEVGAVVLIFDEDRDNRYPYCLTWLGEHQNESDMAFYATNPYENTVGPGIGRAEYGGLLLTLPSQRMVDVWTDIDYSFAETKPERLLMAALDYSLDRLVVYVASRPPRSIFRTIAGRLGRKIIYIPLGRLSPVALKKIRVMHLLDSHDRRAVAKDYIR